MSCTALLLLACQLLSRLLCKMEETKSSSPAQVENDVGAEDAALATEDADDDADGAEGTSDGDRDDASPPRTSRPRKKRNRHQRKGRSSSRACSSSTYRHSLAAEASDIAVQLESIIAELPWSAIPFSFLVPVPSLTF
jgi:hypothetical protein